MNRSKIFLSTAAGVAIAISMLAPADSAQAEDCVLDTNGDGFPDSTAGANSGADDDRLACGPGAIATGSDAVAVGPGAQATGARTTAIGHASEASGNRSVALGWETRATATATTAIGWNARALSDNSVVVGSGALSFNDGVFDTTNGTSGDSVVVGDGATQLGTNNVAVGDRALAIGSQVISIGDDARVGDVSRNDNGNILRDSEGMPTPATQVRRSIGIGYTTRVNGDFSVGVGQLQTINGDGVVSIGSANFGNGPYSTGIGFFADTSPSAERGVAIGAFSNATEADTVSFGRSNTLGPWEPGGLTEPVGPFTRRLINVSDGIADSDAATVGQLNAAVMNANALAAEQVLRIDQNEADIDSLADDVSGNVQRITDNEQAIAALETGALDLPYLDITGDGEDAAATGAQAIAVGPDSVAGGDQSVAIGAGSQATAAGAVAIGPNAVANEENLMALGSGDTRYRAPGITSSASRAAQEGALSLVTSDAFGNLATIDLDVAGLTALDTRVQSLENQLNLLEATVEHNRRQANGGIAAAMAMAGTVIVPDSDWSLNFNLSTFRGAQGFSSSIVGRVTDRLYISGAVGGSTVSGTTGGRVGVAIGF